MKELVTIKAYSDASFSSEVGEYQFAINPKPFDSSYSVNFQKPDVIGRSGANIKFSKIEPRKLKFEFVFDASGVVPGAGDVNTEINKFKSLAYDYNGDVHSPNYLMVLWGVVLFKGRLSSMKVTYKLFSPDGTPIRAFMDACFVEFMDEKTIASVEKKSSPDLTHVRIVVEGDTLPLMCYKIYGDSSYYLKVAAHNNLTSFSDIHPGDKLFFPPIK